MYKSSILIAPEATPSYPYAHRREDSWDLARAEWVGVSGLFPEFRYEGWLRQRHPVKNFYMKLDQMRGYHYFSTEREWFLSKGSTSCAKGIRSPRSSRSFLPIEWRFQKRYDFAQSFQLCVPSSVYMAEVSVDPAGSGAESREIGRNTPTLSPPWGLEAGEEGRLRQRTTGEGGAGEGGGWKGPQPYIGGLSYRTFTLQSCVVIYGCQGERGQRGRERGLHRRGMEYVEARLILISVHATLAGPPPSPSRNLRASRPMLEREVAASGIGDEGGGESKERIRERMKRKREEDGMRERERVRAPENKTDRR
ncbi:hypothetical protein ALC56_02750 [Trachymyrmex septentrionalis]|uniref:Uncharacterized protein n=1 Tax=Trachymyrmex septentrionalis TaxID=34720 RepID=A0A195FR89_9HYME|nr:hypothetical protein ALC56_02750 [Trachymyrmex septentrionalis]